jgi:hypothetical protein
LVNYRFSGKYVRSLIQWIKGALSTALLKPQLEADHSPPFSAELKNGCRIPVFVAWCSSTELVLPSILSGEKTMFGFTEVLFLLKLESRVVVTDDWNKLKPLKTTSPGRDRASGYSVMPKSYNHPHVRFATKPLLKPRLCTSRKSDTNTFIHESQKTSSGIT